ncbi:hypothetical protein J6590_062720 [Homalodisca vitripennis]|nr:hypothetical protein J6590_062720 [Homalodisca vitripennis]
MYTRYPSVPGSRSNCIEGLKLSNKSKAPYKANGDSYGKTNLDRTTPGGNLTIQSGNPLPSGTGPLDSGEGLKLLGEERKEAKEKSISGVMITSSQQREKVGDEPFRAMKTDKTLQEMELEGAEEKKEGRERSLSDHFSSNITE